LAGFLSICVFIGLRSNNC